MKKPTLFEQIHWRIFNVFGRVVGWGFIIAGVYGVLSCSFFVFSPSKNWSRGDALVGIVVGLIVLSLGILSRRAKPYYPEDLREWFEAEKRGGRKNGMDNKQDGASLEKYTQQKNGGDA